MAEVPEELKKYGETERSAERWAPQDMTGVEPLDTPEKVAAFKRESQLKKN